MFIVAPTGVTGQLKISVSGITAGAVIKYAHDSFGKTGTWFDGDTIVDGTADYYINNLVNDLWYLITITGEDAFARGRPFIAGSYYGITLMREEIESYIYGRTTGYRLRITASNAVNMTDKIFLYQRERFSSLDDTTRDILVAVCKPGDLYEYPEDAPVGDIWYFRKNVVDVVEASIDAIEEDWQALRNDTLELLRAMEKNKLLSVTEVYSAGASE